MAILILVLMVLLGIGVFLVGIFVGVPGAIKEPRRPKVAPAAAGTPSLGQVQQEAFARESRQAVAARALTPAGDPDDSPGMQLKVMAGVFSAIVIILALGAYVIWEPGREADAASRQLHENVVRGSALFTKYCAVCHGPTGGGLVGPNLHLTDPTGIAARNKLNPQDPADLTKLRELVVTTITQGRRGTVMPTWGQEFGGPLNETQISNLADLITTNGWQNVVPAAAASAPAAPTAAASDPAVALIAKFGCASCHTISFIPGAVGTIGPNLSHITAVPKIPESSGNLDNTPDNLAKWILNAQAVKPGTVMPNMSAQGMTPDESRQIAAYLEADHTAAPAAGAPAAPAAAGTPAAGAAPAAPGVALLTKYGCVGCHTIATVPGAVGTIGPNLSHVASVAKIPESTGNLDNTPDNLKKWIFNAQAVKPGTVMPNMSAQGMTQDEVGQIVDYLETLK